MRTMSNERIGEKRKKWNEEKERKEGKGIGRLLRGRYGGSPK